MHHANNCLTALSFVLGLLFTFAFTIRRVRRQVPVSLAAGGSAGTAPVTGATAKLTEVPPGPYGAGSAKAGAGGSGPAGWRIKGNEDSMLYHGPDSPAYDATIAELWFKDEQTAKAAGFAPWDSYKHKEK